MARTSVELQALIPTLAVFFHPVPNTSRKKTLVVGAAAHTAARHPDGSQRQISTQILLAAALLDKRDIRTRAHDAISLYVPLPKSELFKKSNEYNKPVIWNSLPPNIRSINDPNQYKTEIKRYYIRMFLSDNNLDQDH